VATGITHRYHKGSDSDATDTHVVVGSLGCNTGPKGHDAGNFACNQAVDAGHLVAYGGNNTSGPMHGAKGPSEQQVVAYQCQGTNVGEMGHLRAGNQGTTGGVPFVPIDMRQASRGDKMTNNRKEGSSGGAPGTGIGEAGDPAPSLAESHPPAIAGPMAVRRLTPVECSRLQGFPDDYLSQVTYRGKCPPADGPMYRALGNSMATPVMRWIGRRIVEAQHVLPFGDNR